MEQSEPVALTIQLLGRPQIVPGRGSSGRTVVAMATTLRARRGEPGALDTAVLMASELDNPVVHQRVATAGGPVLR